MRWLTDLTFRLRALLGRDRMQSELDEEVAFHIEKQTLATDTYGILVAKSATDPDDLAGPIRAAARAVDPRAATGRMESMDDVVEGAMAEPRAWPHLRSVLPPRVRRRLAPRPGDPRRTRLHATVMPRAGLSR